MAFLHSRSSCTLAKYPLIGWPRPQAARPGSWVTTRSPWRSLGWSADRSASSHLLTCLTPGDLTAILHLAPHSTQYAFYTHHHSSWNPAGPQLIKLRWAPYTLLKTEINRQPGSYEPALDRSGGRNIAAKCRSHRSIRLVLLGLFCTHLPEWCPGSHPRQHQWMTWDHLMTRSIHTAPPGLIMA